MSATEPPPADAPAASEPRWRREAVLIVHGIGEQISNDTARSLASALGGTQDRVRSGADLSIDGGKQRVYSVVWDADSPLPSPTTFVHEAYWAYRFRRTSWSHVTGWLLPLLRHGRDATPPRLRRGPVWLSNLVQALGWVAATAVIVGWWSESPLGPWLAANGSTVGAVMAGAIGLLWLTVLAPDRRGVPWTGLAILLTFTLLGYLFALLETDPAATWAGPAFYGGVALLVAVVLAAVAIDTFTTTRALAIASLATAFVLVGNATREEQASTALLSLLASAFVPILGATIAKAILPSLGDAARYLRSHPSNEEESRAIRRIALGKLRSLHDHEPSFDRIVVIGHSLGSVIAYEALNHYWAEQSRRIIVGGHAGCSTCDARTVALRRLEDAAARLAEEPENRECLASYRRAQWIVGMALRDRPSAEHEDHASGEPQWLVTDFISVGSPIASIDFLANHGTPEVSAADEDVSAPRPDARNVDAAGATPFSLRVASREYPTCPPLPQTAAALGPDILLSPHPLRFPRTTDLDGEGHHRVQHAGVFAATRWTNAYFANDLVGGPVSRQLGPGVLDIEIPLAKPSPRDFLAKFSHTYYWRQATTSAVNEAGDASRQILRDLVQLFADLPDGEPEVDDLEGRDDVVMQASASAALEAISDNLDQLRRSREMMQCSVRRHAVWDSTLATLRAVGRGGSAAIENVFADVQDELQDRCWCVVAAGDIVFYPLAERHSFHLRVAVRPEHGRHRCRVVTDEGDIDNDRLLWVHQCGKWVGSMIPPL